MDKAEFLSKIRRTVEMFYDNDSELIKFGVNERTIAHRVALYMEPLFENRDVDCEYNRYGDRIKELTGIRECRHEHKTDRIYPDIVVHERSSEDKNNIAVIEIKPNAEIENCDRLKLELMTRGSASDKYKYEFGVFLGFEERRCKWVLFVQGEKADEGEIEVRA